jgi:hypothetical protein
VGRAASVGWIGRVGGRAVGGSGWEVGEVTGLAHADSKRAKHPRQ